MIDLLMVYLREGAPVLIVALGGIVGAFVQRGLNPTEE